MIEEAAAIKNFSGFRGFIEPVEPWKLSLKESRRAHLRISLQALQNPV